MSDLRDRLIARIEETGPMPFRDWMDACLYDETDGYYMRPGRKTGVGADGPGGPGDFATSPTLHPFMAQAVAKEAAAVWRRIGAPDRFVVVEFGGGEGDLARDALAALDADEPDLAAAIQWIHVEKSPVHRGAQQGDDARVRHSEEAPAAIQGLVVAHEFVDALPVHVLERRKGNWAELHVTYDAAQDRFVEMLGMPRRRAIDVAPKRLVDEGQRVCSMVDAKRWMRDVCSRITAGAVLVVDYGDRGKHLWVPDRPDGTVRGFRDHELVEDVLADPGEVDITASVDFTGLREWALAEGLRETVFASQEQFLVEHGALEALATAPRDTVEDASAYLRLKQLVIPQGFGSAFKVARYERGA